MTFPSHAADQRTLQSSVLMCKLGPKIVTWTPHFHCRTINVSMGTTTRAKQSSDNRNGGGSRVIAATQASIGVFVGVYIETKSLFSRFSTFYYACSSFDVDWQRAAFTTRVPNLTFVFCRFSARALVKPFWFVLHLFLTGKLPVKF